MFNTPANTATETCSCGASITVSWYQVPGLTWNPLREWRREHQHEERAETDPSDACEYGCFGRGLVFRWSSGGSPSYEPCPLHHTTGEEPNPRAPYGADWV